MSRRARLGSSPKHRRDLHREFSKPRRCYCLRGGLKLANCFGSWDSISLEVPPGNANPSHVCDGSFLLEGLGGRRSYPPAQKQPSERSKGSFSLGYLTRSGKSANHHPASANVGAGQLRFHHFDCVEDHIKHYRVNKPNTLHSPSSPEPRQTGRQGYNSSEVCNCSTSQTLEAEEATSPQTNESSKLVYPHPCTFQLRAQGKAIIPSCTSLIMKLPSSPEVSSNSCWVPVNAVFQRRIASAAMYHSFGYYDQHESGPGDFPSLRKKTAPATHGDAFPPSKRKSTKRRSLIVERSLQDVPQQQSAILEEPEYDQPSGTAEAEAGSSALSTHRTFAGQGRLLSGQLRSSSVLPTHPDKLPDVIVGIPKSAHARWATSSRNSTDRWSRHRLSTKSSRLKARGSSDSCSNAKPSSKPNSGTTAAAGTGITAASGTGAPESDNSKLELTLNKLDILCTSSESEGLIEVKTIDTTTPQLELKPLSVREVQRTASTGIQRQETNTTGLYTPSSVAITFSKPRKLFRLSSTHVKLLQRKASSRQLKDSLGSKGRYRETRSQTYCSSGQNTKHRLALNREEEGGKLQGVFGVQHQNHPTMKCVLRSRERRKLILEQQSTPRQLETRERVSKAQVYLIKTKRSLDTILPDLTPPPATNNAVIDLYGE